MKYNRSEIMKQAHSLKRKYSVTFSEALRAAWTSEKTEVSFEIWKQNKHDTYMSTSNYPGKKYPDLSFTTYLKSRETIQNQVVEEINIDDLNFADL